MSGLGLIGESRSRRARILTIDNRASIHPTKLTVRPPTCRNPTFSFCLYIYLTMAEPLAGAAAAAGAGSVGGGGASNGSLVTLSTIELQAALQTEVAKLNAPRLGQIVLDVCVCAANKKPTYYQSDNSNAHIYLHPKYSTQTKEDDSTVTQPTIDPRMLLVQSIQRSALAGGDNVIRKKTTKTKEAKEEWCVKLVCQACAVYRGAKVDKNTSGIVFRSDYRQSSIYNDKKNQRTGQKGRNASHRTDTVLRMHKEDGRCGFSISVYENSYGYYIKPKPGNFFHQYHAARTNLRMPSRLLPGADALLMKDMNSARALTGVAVNTHFVRSSRRGTPTVLSRDQVRYLCNRKNTPGSAQPDE